jgi:Sensors of blue-light using FAD
VQGRSGDRDYSARLIGDHRQPDGSPHVIRRIVYTSLPRHELPAQEIARIAGVSRARNERDGISGVLIYTGMDFVQLIEGEGARVQALWQRIRADARHVDIVPLLDEPDARPWFADWRMGYLVDTEFSRRLAEWRAQGRWTEPEARQEVRLRFAAADSL